MSSVRTENEPSPVERISAAAREFIIQCYQDERDKRPFLEWPNVPDYADLEDELRPYIIREICQAIANSRSNANFDFGALMREWNRAEAEISRRELDKRAALPALPPAKLLGPGEGK